MKLISLQFFAAFVAIGIAIPADAQPSNTAPSTKKPPTTEAPARTKVECPAIKVTVGVEVPTVLPAPWWDTPYVMDLDSTSLTTVAGKQALRCTYKGSGREWDVSRPLSPEFQSCTSQGKYFMCLPIKP